jgi:hypothetical protein
VASKTKLASNASDNQVPQTGMASQTAPSVGMERSLSGKQGSLQHALLFI